MTEVTDVWDVPNTDLFRVVVEGYTLEGLGRVAGGIAGRRVRGTGQRAVRVATSTSADYGFMAQLTATYRKIDRTEGIDR